MLSHEQAQELHELVGMAVNGQGDWRGGLDAALELVAIIVSDTEPKRHESREDGQEIRVADVDTPGADPMLSARFTRMPKGRVGVALNDAYAGAHILAIVSPEDWDRVVQQME